MSAEQVDLFAGGLGGFSWAGKALGYWTLGIEWDAAAVATRHAAGLATVQADVAALDPLDFAPVVGLTGGPPCQAFSMAGKGAGRSALEVYAGAIRRMGAGESIDAAELDAACGDERAHLVLEPLRWALALLPRWVACEQVEPVLPLWEAMAAALREHGYWTWTGICSAEQYGVPQTRRRAFMLASLDGPVDRPPATHQRYIAPRRRDEATEGMFALPEPERIVAPEDRGLLPWVSMAQALGWTQDGWTQDKDRGSGMTERHGERPPRQMGEPSFTIDAGTTRCGTRLLWKLRANAQSNACERGADEPAPTITGGHDHNERAWVLRTENFTGAKVDGQPVKYERPVDHPSPTLGSRVDLWEHGWVESRPATTVNGDPRISEPGHHDSNVSGSQQANAVRVSLAEALVLQSFPPDYPVQGSKSAAFRQVGDAIPRLLALAVLSAVTSARDAVPSAPPGILSRT